MRLKGKKIVVAGLDKSGIGAVKYFISKGANVTVVDMRNRLEVQKALMLLKDYTFTTEFGRYNPKTFTGADLVLVSMKVKHDEKVLAHAKDKRVPVKTEYEFTAELINKPIICVTGTNGKSTTAVMISEMLRHTGKKAYITGHLGKSIYEYLINEDDYDVLILELDADHFRHAVNFDFDTIVLLNITDEKLVERADSWQTFADHVKHYTSFMSSVSKDKVLVYSRDCENVFTVVSATKSKGVPFSVSFEDSDVTEYKHGAAYVRNCELVLKRVKDKGVYSLERMKLRGEFNRENLMAAVFTAKRYNVKDDAVNLLINTFAGVEHRLELVQRKNDVIFYNDARVSTVRGLIRSLSSFAKPVILIAGGKDRGESYEDLCPVIRSKVKTLILLGESKERMNRVIGDCAQTFIVGTFEEAVVLAYQKSQRGDVILYSPGCLPSENFTKIEERGKHYKEIISTF
ncbi:MAG: UDP-N-acetylmuramoyl-L-alanine--D-glutamate ligase [Pseudomonadota bacterium]